jgi:hypothetical protein
VGARSGQDDANGFFPLVAGQRTKKEIDQCQRSTPLDWPGQTDDAVISLNKSLIVADVGAQLCGIDGRFLAERGVDWQGVQVTLVSGRPT